MIEQSNLAELIREKAAMIEENMKLPTQNSSKNIDMTLIEELKRRRREQISRNHDDDIRKSRDEIVSLISSKILGTYDNNDLWIINIFYIYD